MITSNVFVGSSVAGKPGYPPPSRARWKPRSPPDAASTASQTATVTSAVMPAAPAIRRSLGRRRRPRTMLPAAYQTANIPMTTTGMRWVPAAAPKRSPATTASRRPARPRTTAIATTTAQTATMRPMVSTR